MTSTPTFPQAISLSDFPADVLNIAAGAVGEMPDRPPFKADVLLAIANAIMADRQSDQWQDISTAPKDQRGYFAWPCLVGFTAWGDGSQHVGPIVLQPNGEWEFTELDVDAFPSPTRWQHLPTPPKSEA